MFKKAGTLMGITITQSYSLVIRNALFDAVSTDPFFADYNRCNNKMLTVQTQLLPYSTKPCCRIAMPTRA